MIFTPRFYLVLALSVLLSIASLWQPQGANMSLGLTVLLFGASLFDILVTPRRALTIQRFSPVVMTQGIAASVRLHIRNHTTPALRCRVVDGTPSLFSSATSPLLFFIKGQSETDVSYTVKSDERGEFFFGAITYRVMGPLGLLERQEQIPQPAPVRVFPDVGSAGNRDLALTLSSPHLSGRRPLLARGEGREFESLRDYQRDDDFRSIDWKISAKRARLITRQYQAERDQRLLIMIDLGRLMSPRIGSYRKLDYAINAAVRLAQTALYQGDLVGLLLFSHDIAFYLPPHKGSAQFTLIVQALVSAQPRKTESNYRRVFHYAARHNSRRTLMVCFTDLLDMQISQELVEGMAPLAPRHLPLAVTVSDSDLLQVLRTVPDDETGVYRHIAAEEVWNDYQRTIRSLHSRGILTVNVPAADLTPATLNRYLEIKRTARL